MKVKELIEMLSKFDGEKQVVVECDDCEGKWYKIDENDTETIKNKVILKAWY